VVTLVKIKKLENSGGIACHVRGVLLSILSMLKPISSCQDLFLRDTIVEPAYSLGTLNAWIRELLETPTP
jgi:hypothetical protein